MTRSNTEEVLKTNTNASINTLKQPLTNQRLRPDIIQLNSELSSIINEQSSRKLTNAKFNLDNPYFDKKRNSTIDYTYGQDLENREYDMRIEQFDDDTFNETSLIDEVLPAKINRFKK